MPAAPFLKRGPFFVVGGAGLGVRLLALKKGAGVANPSFCAGG